MRELNINPRRAGKNTLAMWSMNIAAMTEWIINLEESGANAHTIDFAIGVYNWNVDQHNAVAASIGNDKRVTYWRETE